MNMINALNKQAVPDRAPDRAKSGKESAARPGQGRLRRLGSLGMSGMTAMALFGPKRFRPHFQQILTVISVVGAAAQFFRRKPD